MTRSVLRQDYENLELIISDNASTDGTEEICRDLADGDPRITYVRQPENIGLARNFQWVKDNARGELFRWIGDDDEIAPTYVSECVAVLDADPRLILVTAQLEYTEEDGKTRSLSYDGTDLGSDDAAVRFCEMLRLLTESYLLLDPMYALFRRDILLRLPYKNMLRGDELYAASLALAGPWGHVRKILGHRHWDRISGPQLAKLLDVPSWHLRASNLLNCRELLACVDQADLTAEQRRRARAAVLRLYVRRHRRTAVRRARKLVARSREFAGKAR